MFKIIILLLFFLKSNANTIRYDVNPIKFELINSEFVNIYIGNPANIYKMKIDLEESRMILFSNQIMTSSSSFEIITTDLIIISDYFYFDQYVLKLPIYIDYEMKFYKNSYNDIHYQSYIKNEIEYDGIMGLGQYSELLKYWNKFILTKYDLFFGLDNHLLEYNKLKLFYNLKTKTNINDFNHLKIKKFNNQNIGNIEVYYNLNKFETTILTKENIKNNYDFYWKIIDNFNSYIILDNQMLTLNNKIELNTINYANNTMNNSNIIVTLGHQKLLDLYKFIDYENNLIHLGNDISNKPTSLLIYLYILLTANIIINWLLITFYDFNINVLIFYNISTILELVSYINGVIMLLISIIYIKQYEIISNVLFLNEVLIMIYVTLHQFTTILFYIIFIFSRISYIKNTKNFIIKYTRNVVHLNRYKKFRIVNLLGNNLLLIWLISLNAEDSVFNKFLSTLILYNLCFISTVLLYDQYYSGKFVLKYYQIILVIVYYLLFSIVQLNYLLLNEIQLLEENILIRIVIFIFGIIIIYFPSLMFYVQYKRKIEEKKEITKTI